MSLTEQLIFNGNIWMMLWVEHEKLVTFMKLNYIFNLADQIKFFKSLHLVVYLNNYNLSFLSLFFLNVGPSKEDIFFDHLLWSIFQSSLHILQITILHMLDLCGQLHSNQQLIVSILGTNTSDPSHKGIAGSTTCTIEMNWINTSGSIMCIMVPSYL